MKNNSILSIKSEMGLLSPFSTGHVEWVRLCSANPKEEREEQCFEVRKSKTTLDRSFDVMQMFLRREKEKKKMKGEKGENGKAKGRKEGKEEKNC